MVVTLKEKLEGSAAVFGMRFKGLSVSRGPPRRRCAHPAKPGPAGAGWRALEARLPAGMAHCAQRLTVAPGDMCTQVATVQRFRKGLPEGASVYVTKNSLMKVAVSQTKGWDALAEKGCEVRVVHALMMGPCCNRNAVRMHVRMACACACIWWAHCMVARMLCWQS